MKLPDDSAQLEIVLDFITDVALIMVLGILVGVIAIFKVQQDTSYGLDFIAGGLTAMAGSRAVRKRQKSDTPATPDVTQNQPAKESLTSAPSGLTIPA